MKKKQQKITFFHVLNTRTENNKSDTTVFRKYFNTDLYINWTSHAPIKCKRGTLKNLISRSISISSNDKLPEDEFNYVRNMFIKIKDYPPKLVNSIIKVKLEKNSRNQQEVTSNAVSKQIQIVLLYPCKNGNGIIRKMNRQLNENLKDDVKVMITYQGTKLSSRF